MNIGFIGAGKVGFSMGKYLTKHNITVTGYYSRSPQSSKEAANFSNTRQYLSLKPLVEDSDVLFLTVPDAAVSQVWEQLKMLPIQNKIISHFSGSLSSAVFSEIERYHAYGYSIHPLFAINHKYNSYKELSDAFFTMEGHEKYLSCLMNLFEGMGNSVESITAKDKIRYHAAAAMASNLYVGLIDLCESMLGDCGFSSSHAHQALSGLIRGNAENIVHYGPLNALTGPIERNDLQTVCAHLEHLCTNEETVYRCLSTLVLNVAKEKYPNRNYTRMEGVIKS